MTRPTLIAGNWKMNLTGWESIELARAIAAAEPVSGVRVAIFPPTIWLTNVAAAIADTAVILGAQNCWTSNKGAFTGEIAPAMIAEFATMVLIGHSERRQILGENEALIRSKLDAALDAGLNPILCVGETLETRQAGQANAHVESQINAALADRPAEQIDRVVVAYEPIWAIGTGVAATAADAQEMCAGIRQAIERIAPGSDASTQILYGGSVNPSNAAELLSHPDVDGALVGGASLVAGDFLAIADAAPRLD